MIFRLALPVAALAAAAGTSAAAQSSSSPDRVLEAQILLDRQHHSPA